MGTTTLTTAFLTVLLATATLPAAAQRIGNRENGKSYQPTRTQVAPAERQAGVVPNPAKEQAENRDIEAIDKKALRQQGMSTRSVPNLSKPAR